MYHSYHRYHSYHSIICIIGTIGTSWTKSLIADNFINNSNNQTFCVAVSHNNTSCFQASILGPNKLAFRVQLLNTGTQLTSFIFTNPQGKATVMSLKILIVDFTIFFGGGDQK